MGKTVNDILLSIGVPTYKRPELLKRTLQSFQLDEEKSKKLIEVVVCDNSDGKLNKQLVEEILDSSGFKWKYNINDLPTELSNTEKMVENFNMCVKLSSGKYVYIIHDDDYLLSNGLNVIFNSILENEKKEKPHDVIKYGASLVNLNEKVLRNQINDELGYIKPKLALKKLLNNSSFVRFPSVVLSRNAYEEMGMWESRYEGCTDIAMWIKMFSEFGYYSIPEKVAGYTIHDEAETNKTFNKKSINYLLELFDVASEKGLLDEKTIYNAKSNFFYQYILGGTYRAIKVNDFDSAKRVLDLLKLNELKGLSPSLKFKFIKTIFTFYLAIRNTFFFRSGKLSESQG